MNVVLVSVSQISEQTKSIVINYRKDSTVIYTVNPNSLDLLNYIHITFNWIEQFNQLET